MTSTFTPTATFLPTPPPTPADAPISTHTAVNPDPTISTDTAVNPDTAISTHAAVAPDTAVAGNAATPTAAAAVMVVAVVPAAVEDVHEDSDVEPVGSPHDLHEVSLAHAGEADGLLLLLAGAGVEKPGKLSVSVHLEGVVPLVMPFAGEASGFTMAMLIAAAQGDGAALVALAIHAHHDALDEVAVAMRQRDYGLPALPWPRWPRSPWRPCCRPV